MQSQFELHIQKWADGCGNSICSTARKRCYARGRLPCDVLFVGEGPGKSENVNGKPFSGPAGHLLDDIICRSVLRFTVPDPADPTHLVPMFSFCITNLVICMPELDEHNKPMQPSVEEIANCAPRLRELVAIADPKLIVAVGLIPAGALEPGTKYGIKFHRKIPVVDIEHPASILKTVLAGRGLKVQTCALAVRGALESVIAANNAALMRSKV
jgi:uracil-DNA glycosylase